MLSIPTAVIVVALTFSVRAFRADHEDGVKGAMEWIRLCTVTSNGSSQVNVTMPCGIQVHSGHNGSAERSDGVMENARGSLNNSHGYVEELMAVVGEKNHQNPADNDNSSTSGNLIANDHGYVDGDYVNEGLKTIASDDNVEEFDSADIEDEGDYEGDNVTVETQDDVAVETQNDSTVEAHEEIAIDAQDEATVEAQDDVTVEVQSDGPAEAQDDGYGNHELYEYQRGNAVTKVMVTYLREARNQLYNKIHYLLNLLQNAFINLKPNHRSRRNSIERERRLENKKKGQSFSSLIMKPTFERSMMTMSFLMFGVFIIRVVQRLMQTLQHSGEHASNSASGNLPAALSRLF